MFAKQLLVGLGVLTILCSCSKASDISFQKRAEAAEQLDPKIAQAQNNFGLKLHQQLVLEKPNQNLFISPTSVSLALSMAYNGSSGETSQAMAKALGWDGMTMEQINQGNQTMNSLLERAGSGIQLSIANSIWTRKGNKFKDSFLKVNKDYYDAEVSELDFNSPKSVDTINKWVKKHTNNKIPTILDKPFDSQDKMAIVNAIYFQGGWKDEFSPSATKDEPFHYVDGSSKNVPMMSRTGSYEYLKEADYQAIRLPYGEGQMDMLVVLPSEASSLSKLHESLWRDPSRLQKPFRSSIGEIKLPRFKLEYGSPLVPALTKLGMQIAFDSTRADFSKMASQQLFIGNVVHKTFLEVNEKGTEAAAATAIMMTGTSAPEPTTPFQMVVDRPFFIAIEDRQTGAWLFTGSIYTP